MTVKFKDNSMNVKAALSNAVTAYLHEAGGEVVAQTARNTKVDTGQLKGSWDYRVNESKGEATIGSPLENAIWEEFGTGEYALNGDGRKGEWTYRDERGKWHKTKGKHPRRAFFNAFSSLRSKLIRRAEAIIEGRMK